MQFKDRNEALRHAQMAVDIKAGVYVFELTGDAKLDDFEKPVLIYKASKLSRGMTEDG
jgi:hypothetical protein